MVRSKPWYKTWANWPSDPDLARLNLGQVGAWWMLYSLAHNCGAGGRLVNQKGRPLSIGDICEALHINKSAEVKVFKSMVDKQLNQGSLAWSGHTLVITRYKEEQETTTTGTAIKGTHEALRERVRRYRERHNPKQVPFPLKPPSPKDKDSTVDSSINTTVEEESNGVTSVTEKPDSRLDVTDAPLPKAGTTAGQTRDKGSGGSPGVTDNPLPSDPVIAEIAKLYEENIGELPRGGVVVDDMIDFAENFTGDITWIKLAFEEALFRRKASWQYIRTILERWQEEGGPDGKAAERLARQQRDTGKGASAHRADAAPVGSSDPLAASRQHGWRSKRSGPGSTDG